MDPFSLQNLFTICVLCVSQRFKDWLRAAKNDLQWGEDSQLHGHHAQCCIISQQVAEKALKALAFYRGAERVKSQLV